ncbi:MAG: TonB-dependent receptor [Flavobacteriales bacterium]|nr:TonB-dependent receptor [Flavobacteriales bacterium]
MKMCKLILISLLFSNFLYSQILIGTIYDTKYPVPFAHITIDYDGKSKGGLTDMNGSFEITDLKIGNVTITISKIGRETKNIFYTIEEGVNKLDVLMEEEIYSLDQIVVTGTKTFKTQTKSPVIVNIIDHKKIETIQACNVSEALNFQSGVRVETDCQTCNYTQLRMNGLSGNYSQILINSKSILSPLTGLYGMEQIPSNMIERIEIIKGGGSSLYGSSSIGGVVNLITKLPKNNNFNFGLSYRSITHNIVDKSIFGNSTVISKNGNIGSTFYVYFRDRNGYDHNGDNFSELPSLNDNTFGANFFIKPSDNQKIEFNFSSLHEYRYGGEMIHGAPHFAMQAEERIHDILMGNIDYNISLFSGKCSLLAYLATQKTNREHYTGVRPDLGSDDDIIHLSNPPYGNSLNTTTQFGFQFNYEYNKWIGHNTFTFGSDIISDYVYDEIPTYNYLVNQEVFTLGVLFQSDWDLNESLNILSGFRVDQHSLLSNFVISPRFSFLYNIKQNFQLRTTYSTGFRAPQAFDTDLHIAFAGGGVSRVNLDPNLNEENSKSINTSINYDYATENYIYGLTFETFRTQLHNAFYLDPEGSDNFGDLFVKRNGPEALVKGISLDLRFNYNRIIQFESGFTIQSSSYNEPVTYSNYLPPKATFLKSPKSYGYGNFSYKIGSNLSSSINYIYTGSMELIHLGGSVNNKYDQYVLTSHFHQFDINFNYTHIFNKISLKLNYLIGVRNVTNAYQSDFDLFKNRDSNYIYGPSTPRMIVFGLSFSLL